MREKEMLAVVEALANQPTAPFHEDAVRTEIEAQLGKIPHVKFERDGFGNIIAHYQRGRRQAATWGWPRIWIIRAGSATKTAICGSSVPSPHDFGAIRRKNRLATSRCGICHPLKFVIVRFIPALVMICSVAQKLSVCFVSWRKRAADAHCVGLFTRAEEVGFVGAIKLAQAGILPRSLTILSLETSTPRGTAEIGRGPIVRVGDRISTFDGPATARLLSIAQEEEIPVQRCLLDGGTCEATAYQLYGYTCAAASVALGNYHNVTPEGTIAAGICRDR